MQNDDAGEYKCVATNDAGSSEGVAFLTVRGQRCSLSLLFLSVNKKYVLWNTGICPIASKLGHVTLATPPFGSLIVPYVVLAYPTKKTRKV